MSYIGNTFGTSFCVSNKSQIFSIVGSTSKPQPADIAFELSIHDPPPIANIASTLCYLANITPSTTLCISGLALTPDKSICSIFISSNFEITLSYNPDFFIEFYPYTINTFLILSILRYYTISMAPSYLMINFVGLYIVQFVTDIIKM